MGLGTWFALRREDPPTAASSSPSAESSPSPSSSFAPPDWLVDASAPGVHGQAPTPAPPPAVADKGSIACGPGKEIVDDDIHGPGEVAYGCGTYAPGGKVVRDGQWTLRTNDGHWSTGTYVEGRQEGLWTYYDPAGWKQMEIEVKHGAPNGISREWLPDGSLFAVRHFTDGRLDGESTIYAPGGTVHEIWEAGVQKSSATDTPP